MSAKSMPAKRLILLCSICFAGGVILGFAVATDHATRVLRAELMYVQTTDASVAKLAASNAMEYVKAEKSEQGIQELQGLLKSVDQTFQKWCPEMTERELYYDDRVTILTGTE